MIMRFSGKPLYVVDDQALHLPFVLSAVCEEALQFGPIRGLGRFTLLDELGGDVEPLPRAVLTAGLQLGRQAEVLRLLFRADPALQNGSNHV